MVHGDPTQIQQVLLNLSLNAKDAMPHGGKLRLSTANVTVTDGALPPVAPGAYVRLSVTDTGAGMTEELGLATVYGIIKQSGGYILLRSSPGEGTMFDIYVPRVEPSEERPQSRALPADEISSGQGMILLVEDEAALRGAIRAQLESAGHRVLEAANGNEALSTAATHDGLVDLILTDIIMPQMDGRNLAAAIAEQRREIPVVFMSGYANDERVREWLTRFPGSFLQKPFSRDVLVAKINDKLKS